MYTLGQAARATGKSKTTISKAVNSGRLSYIEKTKAGYKIDPAELFRVFPKPSPKSEPEITKSEAAEKVIAELRARLDDKTAENLRLQQDVFDWKEQAKTAQRLLEDQRGRNSPLEGLWGLFGGKGTQSR